VGDFDFVVIGSGPAGEKGAAQAAYFGKRVAIVERAVQPGGAPVNTGGIPTKTLREAASYLTGFRRRDLYGVGLGLTPELTLDRLRARAADVTETMASAVRANLERHKIELVPGVAALGKDRSVRVTGPDGSEALLRGEAVLIATGSRPLHPPGIDFADPDVHDSDSVLDLDRIPKSVVVIGGGPVGSEFASIFTALGVEVALIDMADRLIPFADAEISAMLRAIFIEMGMQVRLGSPLARVERSGATLTVTMADGDSLEPEMVLFAAGRVGNTEGLDCEQAGVKLDERGRVLVDHHYQTSVPGIFAAGDVIGPPALGSVSAEQGRVAACHAFGIPFKETVDDLPPFGVYSIPEVGMVGMTEEDAAAAAIRYQVGRARFSDNARSQIAGTTEGMIKLVLRSDDRRLLGVHIVGEEASELIHQGQAVIHTGGTIDRFIHATFNMPTRSEAYKYAAYDALQNLALAGADSGGSQSEER